VVTVLRRARPALRGVARSYPRLGPGAVGRRRDVLRGDRDRTDRAGVVAAGRGADGGRVGPRGDGHGHQRPARRPRDPVDLADAHRNSGRHELVAGARGAVPGQPVRRGAAPGVPPAVADPAGASHRMARPPGPAAGDRGGTADGARCAGDGSAGRAAVPRRRGRADPRRGGGVPRRMGGGVRVAGARLPARGRGPGRRPGATAPRGSAPGRSWPGSSRASCCSWRSRSTGRCRSEGCRRSARSPHSPSGST
jgi:hypothetical protein